MSVSFARAVADGLRAHGITVHWASGWERRGNGQTSAYAGGIIHHTASGFDMALPGHYIYTLLSDGRSDLSGPLCNSAGNEDGSVTIVAAHPANHAGASGGSWARPFPDTRNFNRMVWGHETVYPGTVPMKPAQYRTAQILGGVISGILRRPNPEWIRAHYETSVTGKWDPGYAPGKWIDMNAFRAGIWGALHSTGEDDVELDTTFTSAWGKPLAYGDYLKFSDERLVNIERTVNALSNEMFGPRGPKGEIKGWGTTSGPRTMVAMLVGIHNALHTPIPSGVEGSEFEADPRTYWRTADMYGYNNSAALQQITAMLGAAPSAVAEKVAEQLGVSAENVQNALAAAAREVLPDALADALNDTELSMSSTVEFGTQDSVPDAGASVEAERGDSA